MSKFIERGYVDNAERCETVVVNGVVYNKGSEPDAEEKQGWQEEVEQPKPRGRKKKAE